MPTFRDYLKDLKKNVKEASAQEVQELLKAGDVQLGDVREKD